MVCISHRIQKKMSYGGRRKKRAIEREKKRREKRQTHGMSHEKKTGLTLCFFFLVRSLFHRQVEKGIVVWLPFLYVVITVLLLFSFFLIYISNAGDSFLNYSFVEILDTRKTKTKNDGLVEFFCGYCR